MKGIRFYFLHYTLRQHPLRLRGIGVRRTEARPMTGLERT